MSLNINIKQLKNVFAGGWIDGNLISQCTVTSVECCFENVSLKDKKKFVGKDEKEFCFDNDTISKIEVRFQKHFKLLSNNIFVDHTVTVTVLLLVCS
jgi:hypothetical protein